MRIAMWSGPRNLSTAMMYSFGARDDCAVWDEPFYAAYLEETGLEHPMRAEILAAGERDAAAVAARCLGNIPDGKSVFYQKHMTHHMVPKIDREWMNSVTNIFLIRDPAKVIASYNAKRENPMHRSGPSRRPADREGDPRAEGREVRGGARLGSDWSLPPRGERHDGCPTA